MPPTATLLPTVNGGGDVALSDSPPATAATANGPPAPAAKQPPAERRDSVDTAMATSDKRMSTGSVPSPPRSGTPAAAPFAPPAPPAPPMPQTAFPLMMPPGGFFDYAAGGDFAGNGAPLTPFPMPLPPGGAYALPPFYGALKAPFGFPLGHPAAGGHGLHMLNSRKLVNSAEKRANHNAIERARRDSLNSRFQEIADCIPQLKDLKKPSKSIIMQKTLEYVRVVQPRFDRQQAEIERLRKENERLRAELSALKGVPVPPTSGSQTPDASRTAGADNLSEFDLSQVKIEMGAGQVLALESQLSNPNLMFSSDGSGGRGSDGIKAEGDGHDPFDDLLDEDITDDLPLSEMSDNFDFDMVKERVEHGLLGRHDKDWLLSHGIMKDVVPVAPPLQATSQRMEFKIKQRSLHQQLASRKSVDDLIGMNIIMEQ